jgi:hypothetical protein
MSMWMTFRRLIPYATGSGLLIMTFLTGCQAMGWINFGFLHYIHMILDALGLGDRTPETRLLEGPAFAVAEYLESWFGTWIRAPIQSFWDRYGNYLSDAIFRQMFTTLFDLAKVEAKIAMSGGLAAVTYLTGRVAGAVPGVA